MKSDAVVRRLRAWHEGKPLPLYSTRHFPIAAPEDALILAFVRMGGESSPWGLVVGYPGDRPTILSVPEARNRDLVADMVAEFAPILLSHFRHPANGGGDLEDVDDIVGVPLRQLWVPNPSHLDLLHALSYSYTFTKWGSSERAQTLNAVGRLAGWLFREAQRPGQVTVMTATQALKSAYTFPASDLRQSHLGYLLAWLDTKGNREKRLRTAHTAEQLPISISLDPAFERDELAGLVETWGDAHRGGDERRANRKAKKIAERLEGELVHRHDLVDRALAVLRKDSRRVNAGVAKLEKESKRELWFQYLRLEHRLDDQHDGPAFIPSPETDRHPAAAAARYYVQEGSEEFRINALLHDDEELQEEAIAAGKAVRGKLTDVWDEGAGKATCPVWTLEIPGDTPLRIREGARLCVAGLAGRTVRVRSIDDTSRGTLAITVEVIGLKTVPRLNPEKVLHAADAKLKGKTMTLLPSGVEGISRLKGQRIWARDGSGAWLTHALPGGRNAEAAEDVGESLEAIG
jgi:hypothetical protein